MKYYIYIIIITFILRYDATSNDIPEFQIIYEQFEIPCAQQIEEDLKDTLVTQQVSFINNSVLLNKNIYEVHKIFESNYELVSINIVLSKLQSNFYFYAINFRYKLNGSDGLHLIICLDKDSIKCSTESQLLKDIIATNKINKNNKEHVVEFEKYLKILYMVTNYNIFQAIVPNEFNYD